MRLLFEDGQLTVEAKRAGIKVGDAAGKSMSQRIKSSLGPAIATGIGSVLGAGFAIAAKGAAELDAATRQFQADTGATAEEATKASHAIAGMYRDNLQGFDQISAALSKVHTDLGLTGAEAERVTASFLKFGTATGQDAADAVAGFDDILDAWGLTAAETPRIMDLLIASHQEYGGSIAENEKALNALAPALQALGSDLDDGVGLLNLFAASGLDSSKATAALNKAVKGLKPGETLDDLIKQISSIEDPTLRAQKAIEIFGARGGVGLANALRPGVNSLQDFVPAAEDVAGATERASDAIESSFGNQFKLILKNAGGALAEFGNNFGPLLLVASQFGPKMITAIGGGLGAIAGKLFPGLIARLIPVAAVAGTTTGAAMGTSAAIAEVATQTTGVVAGQAAVAGAAVPAATAGGTLIGRAMGLAASAALILAIPLAIAGAVALIGDAFMSGVKDELEQETADILATGAVADLEARRKKLLGIQRGQRAGHLSGPMVESVDRQLAEIERALANPASSRAPQFGGLSPEERDTVSSLKSIDATLTATQKQLHADLETAISTIKTSNDPAAVGAAIAAVLKSVLGGAGNADQTKAIVTELTAKRDAALARGDTATATLFANAIARLEPFAKGRQWQAEQIAEARKVVASNQTTAEKVSALKGIQQDLLANNRTMAAGIIGKLIDVERAVKNIKLTAGAVMGGQGGGALPRDKRPGPKAPPKAPAKPAPNSSGSPDDRGNAVGLLGMTQGATDIGVAGEAGTEAVAILRNPKKLMAGIARVFVTNWPSNAAIADGVAGIVKPPDKTALALAAIKRRAIAAGHLGREGEVGDTLRDDLERGMSLDHIISPELFVPRASGTNVPVAEVAQSSSGGDTYNVPITGLIKARDPFEIATQLKRVREFVVVTPRTEPA